MSPGRLLYLTRFYAKRGRRYWIAEKKLAPEIVAWRLPEDLPTSTQPVPLHLLTSQHDWLMALWMLASFHHFTARRWKVLVHEDGSLPDEARDAFSQTFPDAEIIARHEADLAMDPALKTRPNCAAYRSRMPHGLKCFDIPHFVTTDRFMLIDPDVIFYSPPTRLLEWVDNPADRGCWFNRDFQEPSPVPPAEAKDAFGIDLWPHVNSGLCLLDRQSIDYDSMEHWLDHPALQNPENAWRVEQTLLALGASADGNGGLLPDTYEVSPSKNRKPGCVARHYVGCVRDRFYSEGIYDLAPAILGKRL